MDSKIKKPLFVIANDDGTVRFLKGTWELDDCGIEAIDVENDEYQAYDSEGQLLKLVTVNENGETEKPTESIIRLPFIGKICTYVSNDKWIEAIPQGIKEVDKLIRLLSRDLTISGYNIDGLTLEQLILIYQAKDISRK